MGGELVAAAGAVVVGLLGLAGVLWNARIQRTATKNEERLARFESWDRLYENLQQESERFRVQRNEAWAANDLLREENARLRRRLEDWLTNE